MNPKKRGRECLFTNRGANPRNGQQPSFIEINTASTRHPWRKAPALLPLFGDGRRLPRKRRSRRWGKESRYWGCFHPVTPRNRPSPAVTVDFDRRRPNSGGVRPPPRDPSPATISCSRGRGEEGGDVKNE
ncbi:hypothetical protein BHE74_00011330 [Ensete ventricosum]|nr:hypothetical protein BHE74_00011330 [Ensete ventricosum]